MFVLMLGFILGHRLILCWFLNHTLVHHGWFSFHENPTFGSNPLKNLKVKELKNDALPIP
jgi:hypothetical protein